MKIISDVIILPFSSQMLGILGLFQSRRKHDLTNIMVHTCVFQKKKKKIAILLGKMQDISALEAIEAVFSKFQTNICLSHARHWFNNKDLAKNKVYTYFNIGDETETLTKLKEK